MKKIIFGILGIVITFAGLWLFGIGIVFSLSMILQTVGVTMNYTAMTSVYVILLIACLLAVTKVLGSVWK
jgi:hypothetical protein|nr:MAG TPA: hypothetical protein [Caudoviricetes sp.]DAM89806.1 MAG TPA: hypothetical protein [Caudoviricetes sp.]DAS05127.1 MAG TPA: hypothetical protein [Caudoviricetes sp.]